MLRSFHALVMMRRVCHCEDDRTKQSSQNGLPRLSSGSLAMTKMA
ncbi:hypothetical protein [Helicobacter fennelliae]|nr:hypothetical protein [Helicobacter fennelliae]